MQKRRLPAEKFAKFGETILSAMLCLTASKRGIGCFSRFADANSLPISIAQSKIFSFNGSIAGRQFCFGVNFFKNSRHADKNRRAHFLQIFGDFFDRFGVINRHSVQDVKIHPGALKNVRQRQNGKRYVLFGKLYFSPASMTFEIMLMCESITPFGSPVVPEV